MNSLPAVIINNFMSLPIRPLFSDVIHFPELSYQLNRIIVVITDRNYDQNYINKAKINKNLKSE